MYDIQLNINIMMLTMYKLVEIIKTLIFEIITHKVKIIVPESFIPSINPCVLVKLYSRNKKLKMHKTNPCQRPRKN